ncbi:hypothetical protein PV721_33430 [Streptomyces sp. MB09-01]|uniref:hypothetical protein n=1 Tax=Streptomyces sp. MB09-01 TaxID=3028666 RepID=UPI0029B6E43D|nr:hypothetical protein [Streptomyces sp. MB09-01]MDX3539141.1 hypothetical protein [Streptomyces sp. MB09-01]
MAAHPALHALSAAVITTAILAARWWATRSARDTRHGVSRPPWRRAAPTAPSAETAHERGAELHAELLDPALRDTDAHLDRYWSKLASLYPNREGERR